MLEVSESSSLLLTSTGSVVLVSEEEDAAEGSSSFLESNCEVLEDSELEGVGSWLSRRFRNLRLLVVDPTGTNLLNGGAVGSVSGKPSSVCN